jgi:hypothetical protein
VLRQNSELRPHRIWNWTLPAWYVTRADGTRFHTCPNAGICAQYCYARNGTYRFSNVLAAHTANLDRILDDPNGWLADMTAELSKKKYRPTGIPRHLPIPLTEVNPALHAWVRGGGAAVRIHDSGDFFAKWYLDLWATIAGRFPDVLFYAYTKEVAMVKDADLPSNLRILFSTGGLQDHLIDPDRDRHADVFPDEDSLIQAGYTSQSASDLLAILLPTTRVGIPANNIPHFNRQLAGRRFSEAVPVRLRMGSTVESRSHG